MFVAAEITCIEAPQTWVAYQADRKSLPFRGWNLATQRLRNPSLPSDTYVDHRQICSPESKEPHDPQRICNPCNASRVVRSHAARRARAADGHHRYARGGQSASPDGSSETRNDGRYQNSLEAGLLRGAQEQCNQWWDTSMNAYRRAKEAETREDYETASYWYGIQDEYLAKYEAQCTHG